MKILKLIGALILSLALFIDVGPVAVHAQENELVSEDDAYDSTFSGPLIYCRRADTAVALSDDGETMPVLCDNEGKLYTTSAGGSGGAVTNAGTFAVQEDGAALTAQQAIQTAVEGTVLTQLATNSVVDTNNSTTSTLTSGSTYTGTGTDVTGYAAITIQLAASHDSAANGMRFEFSEDDSNWDISHQHDFDVSSAAARHFQFSVHAKYFRVVYVNGGINQTHLRIQTLLHRTPIALTSIQRLDENEAVDRSAEIVKAVLLAQKAGSGEFIPIQSTAGGNLKMSVQEISDGLDIAPGAAGSETQLVGIATDDEINDDIDAIRVAVQIIDDSVAAEGAALGSGVLLQGDDGTDRKNVNVDPSTGDVQVDVTNTVTVDLAGNNDVVLTAGLLHADSPTTEVAILLMIDGSADTDIVTTNLSKSSAITITGSGRITKICLVVEGTSPFSEDGTIYFFDADPAISSNTDDMTVAEAITVTSMVSLKGTDYNDNFATIKINCQATDESFHAITHVVYEQEGSTTIANQDFQLHIWYRRDA